MPMIDAFKADGFSLSALTAAVNDREYVPGRTASMFEERGEPTTSIQVEKDGNTLVLIQSTKRGGPGDTKNRTRRQVRTFNMVHLQRDDTIVADEIQNLRAFGSDNDLQALVAYVNRKIGDHADDLNSTHEWHRIGAIKGEILDADNTSIYNLFTEFGVSQQSVDMVLDTATTNVRGKCTQILEAIESALGGTAFQMPVVLCGSAFWQSWIDHAKVRDVYLNTERVRDIAGDPLDAFTLHGLRWERYRGAVGGTPYIATNEAYVVPQGVRGHLITRFAPADYNETVNTIGLPFYAMQWEMDNHKGVNLEIQSNPIHMCTRPRANIKLNRNT